MNRVPVSVESAYASVEIRVDGRPLKVYLHQGHYFVAGQPGKSYSIFVRNRMGGRLEVVESVDGRDVLKDQPASLSNSGMVIRSEWENHGWRINDQTTRDFVFSDPAASIAAQATGSTSNVGVIGVAVFREKIVSYQTSIPKTWTLSAGHMPGSVTVGAMGASEDFATSDFMVADLGTGMGQARNDSVGRTDFERASAVPDALIEIQYRTEQWLRENGIIGPVYPSAFGGDETGYGKYAK